MPRKTSLEVYNQITNEGLIGELQWQVYDVLFRKGPLTAQETWHLLRDGQARLGDARINGITPRFSELKKMGVVEEVGEKYCSITGRNCILWDVTDSLPEKPWREEDPVTNHELTIRAQQEKIKFLEDTIERLNSEIRRLEKGELF